MPPNLKYYKSSALHNATRNKNKGNGNHTVPPTLRRNTLRRNTRGSRHLVKTRDTRHSGVIKGTNITPRSISEENDKKSQVSW